MTAMIGFQPSPAGGSAGKQIILVMAGASPRHREGPHVAVPEAAPLSGHPHPDCPDEPSGTAAPPAPGAPVFTPGICTAL